jgi:hypothetical protein
LQWQVRLQLRFFLVASVATTRFFQLQVRLQPRLNREFFQLPVVATENLSSCNYGCIQDFPQLQV